MTQVNYSGKTVYIDGTEIEMPSEVVNTASVDGIVLVHCHNGELEPRNVVALDSDGNRLWRIQPLKKEGEESARRVNHLTVADDFVQVRDGHGDRYRVDLETGDVEFIGWSR
ncbi:PQQ-binding-like beta-propeller repeat protein [Halomicrobium zhouii]|uniref:hypothetical protein n=1 Tax=Halomicrobium zhouii TaxID=767519 RepID=UPI0015A57AA1|nr:hypothetical protein [Halomicrobium zhouii]